MKAIMNLKGLKNTQELQTFLDKSQAIVFSIPGNKKARYDFIQSTLKQFEVATLNRTLLLCSNMDKSTTLLWN